MNTGLGLALIGLAGVMQSVIVLHAQIAFEITSIYLLTLVPIGVSLTLGGIEMVLAETIYRHFSLRDRRTSKWKTSERGGLRALMGKMEMASILSALLVLALSFASYFSIAVVLTGTSIPNYARFVLAESTSMIVTSAVVIIIRRIM